MRTYAACVEDGVVTNVIVGTADWANANLDGVWVDCDKIGVGWLWDGEVFSPPDDLVAEAQGLAAAGS
jgi:hypothetical protein